MEKPGFKCGFQCGPPRQPFLRSCSFPLSVTSLSVSNLREIKKSFKQSVFLSTPSASLPWHSSSLLKTSHAGAWGPCSRDWVRSAKRRLLYCHTSLHKRNVVKRFRLPLLFLQVPRRCSHLLLYSCQAGAALLLLMPMPCSEHRWPSSHPGCSTASSAVQFATLQG